MVQTAHLGPENPIEVDTGIPHPDCKHLWYVYILYPKAIVNNFCFFCRCHITSIKDNIRLLNYNNDLMRDEIRILVDEILPKIIVNESGMRILQTSNAKILTKQDEHERYINRLLTDNDGMLQSVRDELARRMNENREYIDSMFHMNAYQYEQIFANSENVAPKENVNRKKMRRYKVGRDADNNVRVETREIE